MSTEISIAIAVFLGGGALVAGVQALPPLTNWEVPVTPKDTQAVDWLDGAPTEFAYCQQRLRGVDCGCFADKAGQILGDTRPQAMGWSYANKMDLALNQSARACR